MNVKFATEVEEAIRSAIGKVCQHPECPQDELQSLSIVVEIVDGILDGMLERVNELVKQGEQDE